MKEMIESVSKRLGTREQAVKNWVESNNIDLFKHGHLIVKSEYLRMIIEDICNNNTNNLTWIIKNN